MSIAINRDKCIGCGRCTQACPGSLIGMSGGKAVMRYPEECWGCTACLKECPVHAVRLFLGADIGGGGTLLHTERQGEILRWIFERPDGTVQEIPIDTRESNKY
ncbi:MAG TPA: ferredoxin family protein [Ruminococcus sp.]|nr:ferredoxin family protein [Ruminococcus sp.]HOR21915.1 ferredoxin family protein [Ruminococcus sp.]